MQNRLLAIAIFVLSLTFSLTAARAEENQNGFMVLPPVEDSTQGQGTTGHGGIMGWDSMMGHGMMGHGMMGHGMMGHGMMGHGTMEGGMGGLPIMRVMFALMDADGDGTISLPEFLAAHERIFKAMDADKDGKLTFEEMQAFMRGQPPAAPRQQPAQ